jgi:ABC-type phosphate transport system permease subunit
MMRLLVLTLMFSAIALLLMYSHALYRLYYIIAAERPEWVNHARNPFPRFYAGIPQVFVAYTQFQVLRVAFGSRHRDLTPPAANLHARRIQFSLPISVAAFYLAVFLIP